MVMAVAEDEGKTRRSSRETYTMKNLRTLLGQVILLVDFEEARRLTRSCEEEAKVAPSGSQCRDSPKILLRRAEQA